MISGCTLPSKLPRLSGDYAKATVAGKGDFIELKDGEIKEGKVRWSGDKNLKINEDKYKIKNLKSFQIKYAYYVVFNKYYITRIVSGRINVYEHMTLLGPSSMKGSHGPSSVTYYFLQKGDNAKIEYFDIKTLEKMVNDNPTALEWVTKYKNTGEVNNLFLDNAIQAYNSL